MKVLILGEGLAGSIAALKAAELGADVTIISQEDAASAWAQGGIVYRAQSGDPHLLKKDVLSAGSQMNSVETIDLVMNEGPRLVEEWFQKKYPIPFDVQADGRWALGLEGAHSARRILHISDQTGAALLKPLRAAIRSHKNIKIVKGEVVELLVSDRHSTDRKKRYEKTRCFGAYVLTDSEIISCVADATLLATGGFSGLYLHSSGPRSNFGGGLAAAQRAGVRLLDLEFVQFHPTTLFVEGKPRKLLTEALRGEGAKLLNIRNESFVDELAPRDIVARAIHSEIAKTDSAHVFLDLRKIDKLDEKFHQVAQLLKENNFDYKTDLIPVVPAAHYTMGGIWTDLNAHTSLAGLWAAGEVACTGLHGANRLASMSLLETLVFGDRAATSMLEFKESIHSEALPWIHGSEKVDPILVQQDWTLLRQTMWNYVGIVRSVQRLERAVHILQELKNEVEEFYRSALLTPQLLALRQGVIVGIMTAEAALRRRQSVGAHYIE